MHIRMTSAIAAIAMGAAAMAGNAYADDADTCKEVGFSDVGWSCITATTAVATTVLEGLGYEPKATVLSVPVTFASLSNGDIDAFLGLWLPTQQSMIDPYFNDGTIENVSVNLEGAKYTPRRAYLCFRGRGQDLRRYRRPMPTSSTARYTASSPAMTAT